jgi:hypothetical protein
LKEFMSEKEWEKRLKGDDGIDKVEDGGLDDDRGLERANSGEICESITSNLCMLLERRL